MYVHNVYPGQAVEFVFSLKTKITIFCSMIFFNYCVQTRFLNNLRQIRSESKDWKAK